MKLLAIDSSAKSASVAIIEDKKLLGEFFINVGLTHSQTLMPMVESILKSTNINIKDIDVFAVNAGPGSFTGIRIGVSSIKGMAMPENIPCIPISTLYSMAYNLLGANVIVCAVMDARCGQVYNAIFDVSGEKITRLSEDRTISIEKLYEELEKFEKKVIFVGDGSVLCYNKKEEYKSNVEIASEPIRYQKASSVAFAAFDEYLKGTSIVNSADLLPTYLRIPQAERELKTKNKN